MLPQIMEARKAAPQSMGAKPRSPTDGGRHARQRVLSRMLRDADAALGNKERILAALADDTIAEGLIGRQRRHRRGVQGHDPRFSEFGATDEECDLSGVEIAVIECDDLGAAQTGHGKESKQRLVGAPTQSLRRQELARGSQQLRNILLAIETGWTASIATRQEIRGGDFRPGVPQLAPLREASDHLAALMDRRR
jgi:hypothetical protein